jgi:hypothetical protein
LISARIRSGDRVAGPMVQTIFVRRRNGFKAFSPGRNAPDDTGADYSAGAGRYGRD